MRPLLRLTLFSDWLAFSVASKSTHIIWVEKFLKHQLRYSPTPDIKWSKAGGMISYKYSSYENYGKTLVIQPTRLADEGSYECKAGNVSHEMKVVVSSKRSHTDKLTFPGVEIVSSCSSMAEWRSQESGSARRWGRRVEMWSVWHASSSGSLVQKWHCTWSNRYDKFLGEKIR